MTDWLRAWSTLLLQPRVDPQDEPPELDEVQTLVIVWEMTVHRSVHQSKKGRWYGRDEAGNPILPTKHLYDPAFLKFIRRNQHMPVLELIHPDHRAWRKVKP
jgi:hypothetical protein